MVSCNGLCLLISLVLAQAAVQDADPPILPDLVPMASMLEDVSIEVQQDTGRVLLRLSNGIVNFGSGALRVEGQRESATGESGMPASQIFRTESGGEIVRSIGRIVYHPGHRHSHLENVASYRLRRVDSEGNSGEIVARSEKISFCLFDVQNVVPGAPTTGAADCDSDIGPMHISPGFADVYRRNIEGQWIVINDVPDGDYYLESYIDPDNRIQEEREENNLARVKVRLTTRDGRRSVEVLPGGRIAPEELMMELWNRGEAGPNSPRRGAGQPSAPPPPAGAGNPDSTQPPHTRGLLYAIERAEESMSR